MWCERPQELRLSRKGGGRDSSVPKEKRRRGLGRVKGKGAFTVSKVLSRQPYGTFECPSLLLYHIQQGRRFPMLDINRTEKTPFPRERQTTFMREESQRG